MEIIVIYLVVLIFSVILHEIAHGYMANWLGDPTARLAGRLTLNPVSHIDPIGSLLLPFILIISGSSILIGYAKPVPYNPYNLRGKWDEALVAGAGPATNVLLALIFGMIVRFGYGSLDPALIDVFKLVVMMNVVLAVFNLIPIPPLDGSKVLSSVLPGSIGRAYDNFRQMFERLGILTGTLVLLLMFYYLSPYFFVVLSHVFVFITGVPLR